MAVLDTIMFIFMVIIISAFATFLIVIAHRNSKAQEEAESIRLDAESIRLDNEAKRNSKAQEEAESIRLDNQAKRYTNAKNSYFENLARLKKDPSNPELRQQTLGKGREFCAITRECQGQNKVVTIYDEVALMNDINAACAASTTISSKGENSLTIEGRLAKLAELKDQNLISESEYNQRRQKILDEI